MESNGLGKCSFSSWYDRFKGHTFKSHILEIPQDVLAYLDEDGIVLPESSVGINNHVGSEQDSDNEDLTECWDKEDGKSSTKAPCFPDFDAQIVKAISALGGSVFPKLNWSSPKDATWIALNNSLECKTPAEIYLLLKSSTFIAHDLAQPFSKMQLHLVLRRWHKLDPTGEFRCFIKNQQIIAICQRHYSNFFEWIGQEQSDIVDDIVSFHMTTIKENFMLPSYVLDVYRKEKAKIYVVDFNPYHPVTDALMFTWDEIDQLNPGPEELPLLRFVEKDHGITSSPYQGCAVPQDLLDLTTGTDPNKLISLLQMKIQSQRDESSSSDDECNAGSDMLNAEVSQHIPP